MDDAMVSRAQRGVTLADVLAGKPRAEVPRPRDARGRGAASPDDRKEAKAAATARAVGGAVAMTSTARARGGIAAHPSREEESTRLTGPFLAPGAITSSERLDLIEGVEKVVDGVFAHLPLKRARYGIDPIQRLRILRTQVDELTDDAFHAELADIVTRLRDAHTRYVGPASLEGHVAVLPFMIEMAGSPRDPTYVVTHVAPGLDRSFKPGVLIELWNGAPIDKAVQRYSEREVGGRPDTQRAWATQTLTARALRYAPPPDELWVDVGYRTPGTSRRAGTLKELRIPWRVVNPDKASAPTAVGLPSAREHALNRALGVNPAAEAIRWAKILLFAPRALKGQQAWAPARLRTKRGKRATASIISTELTETLKAMAIDAPGGPFGYLRIYAFDAWPDAFVDELRRLIPLLPDRGLIIDVRGNPGGYIWAAELALQLFTPNVIQPTKFSVLSTEFTRALAVCPGALEEQLAPWKPSLDAGVRNGELYAQPIPITDVSAANALGQHYGGPVVLVADSTTYSSGDLFAAGFVDNAIGPLVCAGSATGAGGANVWTYRDLHEDLVDSAISLPVLPHGIGLSFSFRRATRSGRNEGIPIEDVGIEGHTYAMTADDLLRDRQDLVAHCIALLKEQPFSQLHATVDLATQSVTFETKGLDRLDVLVDGHPGSTLRIDRSEIVVTTYPSDAQTIELIGFSGAQVRQRRRMQVQAVPPP